MAKEYHSDSIYEVRDNEKMVSFKKDNPTTRIARFLKPCTRTEEKPSGFSIRDPLLWEAFFNADEWPFQVHFEGWRKPQKRWNNWVNEQASKHRDTWTQAGIVDAIMSSTYTVRENRDLVLGLVEFWSPETNTFVFPWGEATITLEDVNFLGGFSVLGLPLTTPVIDDKQREIHKEMMKQRSRLFNIKPAKKLTHSTWMNHFMTKSYKDIDDVHDDHDHDDDIEHVAFLSLWISRYVFPSLKKDSVRIASFRMAIHLSQGTRLELASSVLASLYRNMSFLREKAFDLVNSNHPWSNDHHHHRVDLHVLGQFQLLQLWAFERFPFLGPEIPWPLKLGEPRVARWNKLKSPVVDLRLIRFRLVSSKESFKWRPYIIELKNYENAYSFYRENEQYLKDGTDNDQQNYYFKAFVECLCASELVGLIDGTEKTEKYKPYRVAMQFGMDQDVPGDFSCVKFNWEKFCFYVPPRSFEPGVSTRYFDWWGQYKKGIEDLIALVLSFSSCPRSKNVMKTRSFNKKYSGVAEDVLLVSTPNQCDQLVSTLVKEEEEEAASSSSTSSASTDENSTSTPTWKKLMVTISALLSDIEEESTRGTREFTTPDQECSTYKFKQCDVNDDDDDDNVPISGGFGTKSDKRTLSPGFAENTRKRKLPDMVDQTQKIVLNKKSGVIFIDIDPSEVGGSVKMESLDFDFKSYQSEDAKSTKQVIKERGEDQIKGGDKKTGVIFIDIDPSEVGGSVKMESVDFDFKSYQSEDAKSIKQVTKERGDDQIKGGDKKTGVIFIDIDPSEIGGSVKMESIHFDFKSYQSEDAKSIKQVTKERGEDPIKGGDKKTGVIFIDIDPITAVGGSVKMKPVDFDSKSYQSKDAKSTKRVKEERGEEPIKRDHKKTGGCFDNPINID